MASHARPAGGRRWRRGGTHRATPLTARQPVRAMSWSRHRRGSTRLRRRIGCTSQTRAFESSESACHRLELKTMRNSAAGGGVPAGVVCHSRVVAAYGTAAREAGCRIAQSAPTHKTNGNRRRRAAAPFRLLVDVLSVLGFVRPATSPMKSLHRPYEPWAGRTGPRQAARSSTGGRSQRGQPRSRGRHRSLHPPGLLPMRRAVEAALRHRWGARAARRYWSDGRRAPPKVLAKGKGPSPTSCSVVNLRQPTGWLAG